MDLKGNLSKEQIVLCEKANINIEDREYSLDELLEIEKALIEHVEKNCINEDFYKYEEEYDKIIDIVMDLESESDESNSFENEIMENDHVKLNNGKCGIIVDATNNVYTVEIDEEYKTGNLDEDIMIVALNSIVRKL